MFGGRNGKKKKNEKRKEKESGKEKRIEKNERKEKKMKRKLRQKKKKRVKFGKWEWGKLHCYQRPSSASMQVSLVSWTRNSIP